MKSLLSQTLFATVSIVVAMIGFWMLEGREMVTRGDVASMLNTETPYIADRKLIFDAIAARRRYHDTLASAIQANTTAVADLRVVIAELSVEAKHLHERMSQLD